MPLTVETLRGFVVAASRRVAVRGAATALVCGVAIVAIGGVGGEASAATPDDERKDDTRKGDEEEAATARDPIRERVEVRGRASTREDVAAFSTTLSGAEIDRRGEDLADVLRRVPGARVRDYGGLGSYATMSLRASTSEQVTIMLDGVRQNRALGGPVDLSSIPATQIDEVTVYRGFGPAGYGFGGIGGLVDVRTRAPSDTPEGRVDLVAGELSTARLSGGASFATGPASWLRVGAEWLTSEGDFEYLDTGATPFDPDDDVVRTRLNNELEQGHVLLHYANERVAAGTLSVQLRGQGRERGVPGVDSFPSATARVDEDLTDLTASWNRAYETLVQSLELQLDGFDQRIQFTDLDGDIGLAAQDQTTDLDGGGLSAVVTARGGDHGFTLRAEARRERARVRDDALEAPDRGGADRSLTSLTVEDIWTAGSVTLAPALGWEYREDDFREGSSGTVPPPSSDVSESAWSGKLGVAWAFSPMWTVRGSVGRFHRSPNLLELFGDRGSLVGNPTLRSESGEAIEAGVARRPAGDDLSWGLELVGFARRTDDLIRFRPASQGTAVAENVGEVEVVGLETAAQLAWRNGLALQVGVTVQRATDVSNGFTNGQPLPYQPELLGFGGIVWRRGGFDARWDVTYTGENSTDTLDTPEARLPARWIHDLAFGYRIAGGWEVGLDVRNLFDRKTRDVARFPLPDRVILAHVGWQGGGTR